ncbi:MAG TPA: Sir2 family NAD-dependent protein deacetylase [Mycobacteriales bacterium]|nr:Sir2 family NAD-dependent protein deacetylase [Mycobacteriales bacterium]
MTLAEIAPLHRFSRICVLTGAGLSGAAGLPTFRGPDGVWTLSPELELAMDGLRIRENLDAVWRVWSGILAAALAAGPTAAHRALAASGGTIVTQNVDTLHTLAGSDAIELHGSAGRARCMECRWRSVVIAGRSGVEVIPGIVVPDAVAGTNGLPACPRCGSAVRPDVVLFNEQLPKGALEAAQVAAQECELFLAIGTSGTVAPASFLVSLARAAGALCVNLSLHPPAMVNPAFDEQVTADAEVELPAWLES